MNARDIGTDTELEQRIAEAGAKQEEYNEWRRQLAADCLRRGVAFPNSYGLLRAWNAHQKDQSLLRREEKKKATKIKQLEERAKQAILEIQALSGACQSPITTALTTLTTAASTTPTMPTEEELGDDFFANIDAEIAAMQAKGGTSQEQRAQQIIEQEEAALRTNNLGEL